jgi:hypothetical protein
MKNKIKQNIIFFINNLTNNNYFYKNIKLKIFLILVTDR